jgi:hypothetical protein
MTLIRNEPQSASAHLLRAAARPTSPGTDRTLVVFATALALWSVAYMVPHLYWALGGTIGLSAVKPSASALPEWRAINWAASAVLALPALLAVALVRARPGVVKTGLLLITLAGSAIAAAHGLYGIVFRSITVAGAIDVDGESFDASRHGWVIWDLLVFEPWFLIEGLLLAGVGWIATPPSFRRRWISACAAGIALATLTGLLGVRV